MGGIVGDAVDEGRSLLHGIANELGHQTKLLTDLANKPPVASKKLVPRVQAMLLTRSFNAGEYAPIETVPQGIWMKINHWACQFKEAGTTLRMYYGQAETGEEMPLVDCGAVTGEYQMGNPNELILPPGKTLYVRATKPGIISVAADSYQLDL